jgi:DNA-binding NtrC family response regulator
LADSDTILPEHLPEECRPATPADPYPSTASPSEPAILPLEEVEQRYLRDILARFPGDRRTLAGKLGISERTFYRKIKGL